MGWSVTFDAEADVAATTLTRQRYAVTFDGDVTAYSTNTGTATTLTIEGGPRGAAGDQNVFLLEAGQTVPEYEALHGITVPVGAIIYQKF